MRFSTFFFFCFWIFKLKRIVADSNPVCMPFLFSFMTVADQASDCAVIYEFWKLYNNRHQNNCYGRYGINTAHLFFISLLVFLFSRIISAIGIYMVTRSCKKMVWQFFNIEIYSNNAFM